MDSKLKTALRAFVDLFRPSEERASALCKEWGVERLFSLLLQDHVSADDVELLCSALEKLLSFPKIEAEVLADDRLACKLLEEGAKSPSQHVASLTAQCLTRYSKGPAQLSAVEERVKQAFLKCAADLIRDAASDVTAQEAADAVVRMLESQRISVAEAGRVLTSVGPALAMDAHAKGTPRIKEEAGKTIRILDFAVELARVGGRNLFVQVERDGYIGALLLLVVGDSTDDLLLQLTAAEILERLLRQPGGLEAIQQNNPALMAQVLKVCLRSAESPALSSLAAGLARVYATSIESAANPRALTSAILPHLTGLLDPKSATEEVTVAAVTIIECIGRVDPSVLIEESSGLLSMAASLVTSPRTEGAVVGYQLKNCIIEAFRLILRGDQVKQCPALVTRLRMILIEPAFGLLKRPGSMVDSRVSLYRLLTAFADVDTEYRKRVCSDQEFRALLVNPNLDTSTRPLREAKEALMAVVLEVPPDVLIALAGPEFVQKLLEGSRDARRSRAAQQHLLETTGA